MAKVKTLFSTSVVVTKVHGYLRESWGTSETYGTTTLESDVHCGYRIAKLMADCKTRVISKILVIGGILSLGGMTLFVCAFLQRCGVVMVYLVLFGSEGFEVSELCCLRLAHIL